MILPWTYGSCRAGNQVTNSQITSCYENMWLPNEPLLALRRLRSAKPHKATDTALH